MTYREWLKENKEDAARVVEFKNFGKGTIQHEDGTLDVNKIMDMSVMVVNRNMDKNISIYLC